MPPQNEKGPADDGASKPMRTALQQLLKPNLKIASEFSIRTWGATQLTEKKGKRITKRA
jgi:hypothetical protein